MISKNTYARSSELADAFQLREPFRHVVIDNFLDEAVAQRLLSEFPAFDVKFALNENGDIGGKSVVERIRDIGKTYAELDDLIQTRQFLQLISDITGIPGLQYDPHYFGGGTHENRDGQDLDPHIDFNRHPVDHTHRRLNLIIYLNSEWCDSWGGSLELHRDPAADDNEIKIVTPIFNRAVIFETTKWSWHGFARIALPESRKSITRKSIALYFYSADRPPEELTQTHSTVYVDRPMPTRFADGYVLTEHDVQELRILFKRRDMHIQRLYRDIRQTRAEVEVLQHQMLHYRSTSLYRILEFLGRIYNRLRKPFR
jgi:hypothetical protein